MRSLSRSLLIGAAAMLAGCGGPQPPIGAPSLLQNVRQDGAIVRAESVGQTYQTSRPLLYVTSSGDPSYISVYDVTAKNPKPLAAITKDVNLPQGDCIDGDGTLYIVNSSSSGGWLSEYALGQTRPLRVVTKGINTPSFCAIDAPGNLWVTNIGLRNVTEYLRGSTKPHTTITTGLKYPDGIAIDHAGNMYVGNLLARYSEQSNIQVYPAGSKSPSRTITDGITWPVGIAIDSHDTLYVANFTAPGNVEEYRSGESKPYRTVTEDLDNPADVVLNKSGWLYVAKWGTTSGQQAILEFSPHSVKASSRAITKAVFNPIGLAYYPPVLP